MQYSSNYSGKVFVHLKLKLLNFLLDSVLKFLFRKQDTFLIFRVTLEVALTRLNLDLRCFYLTGKSG